MQKSLSAEVEVEGMRKDLQALGLVVAPFLAGDADTAETLWAETKPLGLPLVDRACLSLGRRRCLGRGKPGDRATATPCLPLLSIQ